jgi:hypothetical protein
VSVTNQRLEAAHAQLSPARRIGTTTSSALPSCSLDGTVAFERLEAFATALAGWWESSGSRNRPAARFDVLTVSALWIIAGHDHHSPHRHYRKLERLRPGRAPIVPAAADSDQRPSLADELHAIRA